MTVRERRYQKPSARGGSPSRPALEELGGERVHALAKEREDGRQHGERDHRRSDGDQRAAEPIE